MLWNLEEVQSTLRMIEAEHLDIRAVTMGISLRGCATSDLETTRARVRDQILRLAERLVPTAQEVQAAFGVPITNRRVSVTPIALVAEATGAPSSVPLAVTRDLNSSKVVANDEMSTMMIIVK